MEFARQNAAEAQQEAAEARQKAVAAQHETAAAQQEAEAARLEQAITIHILRMVRQGATDVEIAKSIMQQFSLDERQAAEKLALAFGDSAAEE
ncbi:MAG: hypothetical protein K2L18_07235 [Acetatifactor sp.]|nr:hypothetical protein [Acetatifactor sp.]